MSPRSDQIVDEKPPGRLLEPYRFQLDKALIFLVLSIFIHFFIYFIPSRLFRSNSVPDPAAGYTEVQLVSRSRPTAETLQETAKEKPQKYKFESSRNLMAEEDVSPDAAPSSVAQKRGRPDRGASTKPKEKAKAGEGQKMMSFSSDELKTNVGRSGDGGTTDSSGFIERLKKGEQLKISALESDYAQYVGRMKRKISQRWNPQRIVTAGMYKYDEVYVEMGVVLDSKGELVDLKIISASPFSDFDEETRKAVAEAAPFPNPPSTLIQTDGFIYMPWKFSVFMRQTMFRLD